MDAASSPSSLSLSLSSGSSMSISNGSNSSDNSVIVGDVRASTAGPIHLFDHFLRTLTSGSVATAPATAAEKFPIGAVVKLHHTSPRTTCIYRHYSYALHCGNGRVIHSWSNTRTHFRVRIDSLRSLKLAGVTATDASDELDAFCLKVLKATPLAAGDIVTRAKEATHCVTHDRRTSLVLILHARYGDVATAMAKSLLMLAPLVIKLNGMETEFSTGKITLARALSIVLHYMDPKNYNYPKSESGVVPLTERVVPTKKFLRELAARVRTTKGLVESDVAPLMGAWIMLAFKKSDPRAPAVAVSVAQLERARAALFFSPLAQAFTVILTSDKHLFERLVSDRMECGICFVNYTDVPTKLLECSHVVCGSCLASLQTRVCPYCRQPITFERTITDHYKALANDMIREEERKGLEANDADAPPCETPSAPPSAEVDPRLLSPTARAAIARAQAQLCDPVVDALAQENEKRETDAMANEDRDVASA